MGILGWILLSVDFDLVVPARDVALGALARLPVDPLAAQWVEAIRRARTFPEHSEKETCDEEDRTSGSPELRKLTI